MKKPGHREWSQKLKTYNNGLSVTPWVTHYVYSVSPHHVGQTGRSYSCLLRTHSGPVYCDPGMDTVNTVCLEGEQTPEKEKLKRGEKDSKGGRREEEGRMKREEKGGKKGEGKGRVGRERRDETAQSA